MQPEQATFLLQSTLPSLKHEHGLTKRVIDAIPADKAGFSPDKICMPAIDMAWHIAAVENMFLGAIARGEFDFSANTRPESVKTPADVTAWYAEKFAANIELLEKASPEQLLKVLDFRGKLQQPAVQFLGIAVKHTVHHRGQLTMYLRPMGAKVPSIYGESFDDAQARKATEAKA